MDFQFGELYENTSAGSQNTNKICMFVTCSPRYAHFLTLSGESIKFDRRDACTFLRATGHGALNFVTWKLLAEKAKEQGDGPIRSGKVDG